MNRLIRLVARAKIRNRQTMATQEDIDKIFDAAIEEQEGYIINPREQPSWKEVTLEEITHPISFDHLPIRSLDGRKKVYTLFDLQRNVDRSLLAGPDDQYLTAQQLRQKMARLLIDSGPSALPDAIRPSGDLPADCKMCLYLSDSVDGSFHVMKVYGFSDGVSVSLAKSLLKGVGNTSLFRNVGGWSIKKALALILDRVPGTNVTFWSLSKKRTNAQAGERQTKWNPSTYLITYLLTYLFNYLLN